jgi:hypothetical protein
MLRRALRLETFRNEKHSKPQADKLIGLQIKLDSILLSCPSCQCVAAIALDREGKSAAYFLPSRPT